jgi:hypothetical protein
MFNFCSVAIPLIFLLFWCGVNVEIYGPILQKNHSFGKIVFVPVVFEHMFFVYALIIKYYI